MIRRILICGCARSGNTLMLHLMENGFLNIKKCIDGPGNETIPKTEEGFITVGKFPKAANRLSKHLKPEDLGAIFMMRDPRDALVSKHFIRPNRFWVEPNRWIRTAKSAYEWKNHHKCILLKYERLLRKPGKVQKEIAEKFNLEINFPFKECYKHFDKEDEYNIKTMNGARPIDPSRIGNWRGDVKKEKRVSKMLENKELKFWMKKFGYF